MAGNWIHFPSVTLSQTTHVTLNKSLKFFGFYQPPRRKKTKVGMGIFLAYRQKAGPHAPFSPWSIALQLQIADVSKGTKEQLRPCK